MILPFKEKFPDVRKAAFVAVNSTVAGDVAMGEGSSIWFGAVIRGDEDSITIGEMSDFQDNVVVHVQEGFPVNVGDHCVVGHSVVLHGCTVEDDVLIGMNATVMNGSVIGEGSIVGANALVTQGSVIPPHSLVYGVPAKVMGTVTDEQVAETRQNAEHYHENALIYARQQNIRVI